MTFLFLLFNVWDLTLYPLVADDEVLLNEPARVLVADGTLKSPLLSPDHVPRHVLVQPPVQTVAVATVYAGLGFGMWQTRFASLVWGALAVGVLAYVASVIAGTHLAGALAAVLLALNPSFVLSARMGRMDALCVALALGAFALVLPRAEDRWPLVAPLAAGVLAALAFLTHFVAFGFLAGMLLVLVLRPAPRLTALAAFVAGGAMVAGIWGAFLASQGGDYVTTLVSHGAMRSAGGSIVQRVQLEAWRWATDGRSYAGIIACYVAGLIYAIRSLPNTHPARGAAIVAGTMLVFNTLAMSKVSGHYAVYPAAFLTLLAATYLGAGLRSTSWRRSLAMAFLAVAVASSLPALIVPRAAAVFAQRGARSYGRIETDLRSLIPSGARVWTVPEAWYALAADGRSVRTPSLGYNPAPDAAVDDYAVLRLNQDTIAPGFVEVGRIGQPLPTVGGRTFASTDYQFVVYKAGASPGF